MSGILQISRVKHVFDRSIAFMCKDDLSQRVTKLSFGLQGLVAFRCPCGAVWVCPQDPLVRDYNPVGRKSSLRLINAGHDRGQEIVTVAHRGGDPAMGGAVRGLVGKRSAMLLANQGPVVAGKDIWATVFAMEELEASAKLAMLPRGIGATQLSPSDTQQILQTFDVDW